MTMIKAKYLGELTVECLHLYSGKKLITNPPTDNYGQGSSFSAMDLFATSIATCILTVIGIHAFKHNIDLSGMEAEIQQDIQTQPRKIESINIMLIMPAKDYTLQQKKHLESIATNCPLCQSIHPDIRLCISFTWT